MYYYNAQEEAEPLEAQQQLEHYFGADLPVFLIVQAI